MSEENKNNSPKIGLKNILLKDIMAKNPFSINIKEPFSRIVEILREHNIRHLPVVDDEHKIKGIVTQRDLYRTISPRKTMEGELIYDKEDLDKFILEYVMTKEVITLKEDDTLGHAASLMGIKKCGCIPVVDDDDRVIGILTQIDVLMTLAEKFYASPKKNGTKKSSFSQQEIGQMTDNLTGAITTLDLIVNDKEVPKDFAKKALKDISIIIEKLKSIENK